MAANPILKKKRQVGPLNAREPGATVIPQRMASGAGQAQRAMLQSRSSAARSMKGGIA